MRITTPLHPPSFLTHRPQLLQRGVPFCSARNRTTSPRKKRQRHKVERADISGGIFLWQIVHTSLRCVCRCRVFVGSGAVVLLALVLRALAISRRPLQILEVRFTNGLLRLSFLSIHTILSQVLKIFLTHFCLVHAQFERSKRRQHYIVVPVPFAYTHSACCNHIRCGDLFFNFWNIVLVPVVCPCLDFALQRQAYSF